MRQIPFRFGDAEQVLGVEDPHHVVEVVLVHGNPRVLGTVQDLDDFRRRSLDRDGHDLEPWREDFAHTGFAQIQGGADDLVLDRRRIDDVLGARLGDLRALLVVEKLESSIPLQPAFQKTA